MRPIAPTKSWVREAGAGPLALLVGLGLVAAPAAAQDGECREGNGLDTAAPTHDPLNAKATASVRTGEIRIDGLPDEAAWQAASVISGFVQREPLEGESAGEDTHVRVLFDDEAIYVSACMFELRSVGDPSAWDREPVRRPRRHPASQLGAPRGGPALPAEQLPQRAGVDLRLGLGSAFTLDATVNPDFGQGEADPAEVCKSPD